METFTQRTKRILQREFHHTLRPELEPLLTELIETDAARGFNEYDAAISTVLAILGLCAVGRINTPVARRTMLEMTRRIVGVAALGRRDAAEVRAAILALAEAKAADPALRRDLAAVLAFADEAACAARILH